MLSAPLMPYLLVGMCFKNLSVLIAKQTGHLLNVQFIDQLLLKPMGLLLLETTNGNTGRRNLLEQRKPFVNYMCIYWFSHQTPWCRVKGRQKRLKYTQDQGDFIIMKGILKG